MSVSVSTELPAALNDLDDVENSQTPEISEISENLNVATDPASSGSVTVDPVPSGSDELTFADLGLSPALLAAVTDLGYVIPSAIQIAAIPALLDGRDITGVAQTGTGKTAAFGLPLLAAIDPRSRDVQALVLTPTRELAIQVSEAIESMATHLPGVRTVAVYGGSSYVPQLKALSTGVQIVVGTPGRVIDHLERGTLSLSGLRFLVLDEADEMLRMGFAEDVDRILTGAPRDRQTALFSATMPPAIRQVAAQHMVDPVDIAVTRQSSTVENVTQTYAVVPFSKKTDALARILELSSGDATIVFTRTKDAAETVGSELIARGISAATISGDVAQRERERIVERLRSGLLDVLVATDVAARGLDVERVDLVVNYDAPGEPETYVHRIGRTGRAGRAGEALTFFTPREVGRLRVIEKLTRSKLTEVTLPTASQVATARVTKALEKATARLQADGLTAYRTAVEAYLAEHPHSAAELATALAALVAGDTGVRAAEPEQLLEKGRSRDGDARRDRFEADRPERSDRSGRGSYGGERSRSDRPYGDRTHGDRSYGDRSSADRSAGNRSSADRPSSDRSFGDRSRENHGPRTDRPAHSERSYDDRGPRGDRPSRPERPERPESGVRGQRPAGKRYRIAVGHADGVRPAGIVGAIAGEGGIDGRALGRIDIYDDHSIVEISTELTPAAFSRIAAARVGGRELRIKRHYEA